MQQLGRYTSHTYTYGENIQSLLQNLEDTKISKPEDINQKTGDATTKRIWEKEIDEYVKRSGIYKSNTKKLYSVVWYQCFLVLQTRVESLLNYNMMHRDNDRILLLKEIRASIFEFENQAYIHNSMLKAKEVLARIRQQEYESNNDYWKRSKEQLEMLNHYRGAFENDEGLILDEYIRENIETKGSKRDSAGYKQMESKAINRAKGM